MKTTDTSAFLAQLPKNITLLPGIVAVIVLLAVFVTGQTLGAPPAATPGLP